jgi:hypothetical protein
MKILAIGLLATGLAVAWGVMPLPAVAAEDNSPAAAPRVEESQDRGYHHHRQHFLYDSEYQPETDGYTPRTDGAAPRAKDCTDERVRVRRGDGTTAVARIDKCR